MLYLWKAHVGNVCCSRWILRTIVNHAADWHFNILKSVAVHRLKPCLSVYTHSWVVLHAWVTKFRESSIRAKPRGSGEAKLYTHTHTRTVSYSFSLSGVRMSCQGSPAPHRDVCSGVLVTDTNKYNLYAVQVSFGWLMWWPTVPKYSSENSQSKRFYNDFDFGFWLDGHLWW